MSISLDPDQAQQHISPDLAPNCLQRLLADNKSCRLHYLERVKRNGHCSILGSAPVLKVRVIENDFPYFSMLWVLDETVQLSTQNIYFNPLYLGNL